jgi:HAD superfamily hydrolase (TIGR01509 family)
MTNRLIIFDLDGVLLNSREIHYITLNNALKLIGTQYIINKDEHLSIYDGLSTTTKLKLLTKNKSLPVEYYNEIWQEKQKQTLIEFEKLQTSEKLINFFKFIKEKNIKIAVASNSVRITLQSALTGLGIIKFVDYWISNEEVQHKKPFPEMYWRCMIALDCLPENTVIFEDSHVGRQGALDSKAHLIPIIDANDLTFDKIKDAINIFEKTKSKKIPWRNPEMNVLIPMAGAGNRFAQAGYTFPKPLIDVNGKPMIQVVVENLNIDAHYIFIVQKTHYEKYNLKHMLNLIAPACDIVLVDGVTEGAACTTLLARKYIDNDKPLIIANSDQYVEWNSNEVIYAWSADEINGGILTFESTHPKWSFAKIDDHGLVSEVAEKKPISNNATVGIYYWQKGSEYVKYADQMIDKNVRTNNEFYVCPVFNEAIQDGKKIKIKEIKKMWGLGTPEDLEYFLRNYYDNNN